MFEKLGRAAERAGVSQWGFPGRLRQGAPSVLSIILLATACLAVAWAGSKPKPTPPDLGTQAEELCQEYQWHLVSNLGSFYLTDCPRTWDEVAALPRTTAHAYRWTGVVFLEPSAAGTDSGDWGEHGRVTRSGATLFGDPVMVQKAAALLDR